MFTILSLPTQDPGWPWTLGPAEVVLYALVFPMLWMVVILVRYRRSIMDARDGWEMRTDVPSTTRKGKQDPAMSPPLAPATTRRGEQDPAVPPPRIHPGTHQSVRSGIRHAQAEGRRAVPVQPDEEPESADIHYLRTNLRLLPANMSLLFSCGSLIELSKALAGICLKIHLRSKVAVLLVDGDVLRITASGGMDVLAEDLEVPLDRGQAGFAAKSLVTLDQSDFEQLSNLERTAAMQSTALPPFEIFFPITNPGRKNPYGVVAIDGLQGKTTWKSRVIELVCTMASFALERIENETLEHGDVRSDALTGLATRRRFERLCRKALAEDDHPMSLCFLGVDLFHKLTGIHGNDLGERILFEVGTTVRKHVNQGEIAARYSEEDFVLLLRSSPAEALLRCESLLREVGEKRFALAGGPDVAITLSGGIAAHPMDGDDLDALIESADRRLFESRNNGRNRVTIPGLRLQGGGTR